MEKSHIMKVWVALCALGVQLTLFVSCCLDFGFFLRGMRDFGSDKRPILKMRGELRRAPLNNVWVFFVLFLFL